MILYIHGFASCGAGNKVAALKKYFGEDRVLSPDLCVDPEAAIQQLEVLIESSPVSLLLGSSLGGFYADLLNAKYRIPTVLINPSTCPFETLRKHVGINTNWCSGEDFEWLDKYCDTLKSLYRQAPTEDERYLVLLQSEDEVLDYRLAERRYSNYQVIIEQGGNHRFENLQDYLPRIEAFVNG